MMADAMAQSPDPCRLTTSRRCFTIRVQVKWTLIEQSPRLSCSSFLRLLNLNLGNKSLQKVHRLNKRTPQLTVYRTCYNWKTVLRNLLLCVRYLVEILLYQSTHQRQTLQPLPELLKISGSGTKILTPGVTIGRTQATAHTVQTEPILPLIVVPPPSKKPTKPTCNEVSYQGKVPSEVRSKSTSDSEDISKSMLEAIHVSPPQSQAIAILKCGRGNRRCDQINSNTVASTS
ncbi:hypothetical protein KIN20_006594 [Parelaphostrongylus tenuis]|uniref:Uncharacterized protein n=1 Tax=Parelaphostrongylus tenuis TaxID=148309 RepID=A0AAD5QGY0_PARTN|nr:hypothetical protein KIN20_006594 [Parelaphostrongylus tenuis]